ncbi:MAG: hypothetical protein KF718_20200 [Polyangiaceae bacterium]|nr:hypothetical protein [Polyangiaceae bacterium]
MRSQSAWLATIGLTLGCVQGCGGDDFSSSSSGGAAGASGSGGATTGGQTGSGGASGADASAVGGTAGVLDAGGSSGAAGSSNVPPTWKHDACPEEEPLQNSVCPTAGVLCCYGLEPASPWRCAPDGNGGTRWVRLMSRVCCAPLQPEVGQTCAAPGDLVCCYSGNGFACDHQPEPDVWVNSACN